MLNEVLRCTSAWRNGTGADRALRAAASAGFAMLLPLAAAGLPERAQAEEAKPCPTPCLSSSVQRAPDAPPAEPAAGPAPAPAPVARAASKPRPAPPAPTAAARKPPPPRCANITMRAAVGEPVSEEELQFLRSEC